MILGGTVGDDAHAIDVCRAVLRKAIRRQVAACEKGKSEKKTG